MIADYDKYNTGMAKSLEDKLFFLDKVHCDTLIDYGCADGTLIKAISDKIDHLIGYDIDPVQIADAEVNQPDNCIFTDDLDAVATTGTTAILLSSVIHEVYSYGANIEEFWNRVFSYDYVIIRDMIPSLSIRRKTSEFLRILTRSDSASLQRVKEFEDKFGSLANNGNMIHYLLKYRYTENWDRECVENYFSLYFEELTLLFPPNYEVVFLKPYTLDFFKDKVKEDFNINIVDRTHLQLILKRTE